MKKFGLTAAALLLTLSVSAQTNNTPQGAGNAAAVKTVGEVFAAQLVAGGVLASVAASIVSNAQKKGLLIDETPGGGGGNPPPNLVLVCDEGDGEPVNGVCTNNSTTVTVTGTGTGTTTITVPVTTTYPAILTQR